MKDRPRRALELLHQRLDACTLCPNVVGPVVHGPPVVSRVMLVGQAPGPREGSFGRPFAWTAGKTMFGWFRDALSVDEATFRDRVYIAAVGRCFPGKASGGGDRRPDRDEIEKCESWLRQESELLEPNLVIPVGTLAIERVLGTKEPLVDVVGTLRRSRWFGRDVDVVPLPHPSGASTWHRTEPGKRLLRKALAQLAKHEAMQRALRPARDTR
jgi:uracil-DNA glycosylase